jgi:predicted HAD superfamily phosphohydrolase
MIQVNLDCEGPITQNDNAYELCEAYIPDGGEFFARVSRYDDYLADVEKREGYKAGDTLKLVLPFLRAWGVTSKIMEDFSRRTLRLLPGAEKMLPGIASRYPAFIISTSYRPYLQALCSVTGFPEDNIYCTDVDIDSYDLPVNETDELKRLTGEIKDQPLLQWPAEAGGLEDLATLDQALVERLDTIFWEIIPAMQAGAIFQDVNPVGGREKAASVADSLGRTGLNASSVFYVGDSITDVQAFELVRQAGGLALSFNGNSYAIRSAEWACISGNTIIIGALAVFFDKYGREGIADIKLDENGCAGGVALIEFMASKGVDAEMLSIFESMSDEEMPRLYHIESTDVSDLITLSESFRKSVRGKGVGELG